MITESPIYHQKLDHSDYFTFKEEIYLENEFPTIKISNKDKLNRQSTKKFSLVLFYTVLIILMNLSMTIAENNFECKLPDQLDQDSPRILNESSIHFVCGNLTNVCERICYVRNILRYELCDQISLLYMLPNIEQYPYIVHQSESKCSGLSKNAFSTDHLFENFLSTTKRCLDSLTSLTQILEERLIEESKIYDHSLKMSFCINRAPTKSTHDYPGNFYCNDCQNAYRNWLCSVKLKTFIPITDENSTVISTEKIFRASSDNETTLYSSNKSTVLPKKIIFRRVSPCESWCIEVEKLCPYLNPSDDTTNGGEPAFLCDESHYNYQSRSKTNLIRKKNVRSTCCYDRYDLIPLSGEGNLSIATVNSAENTEETIDNDCQLMPDKCLPICRSPTSEIQNHLDDGDDDHKVNSSQSPCTVRYDNRMMLLIFCSFQYYYYYYNNS